MSLGKQSAPATPDYAGAAQATAAGNLEAAKYATTANRSTQVTPYGTLSWKKGATDNDPWTQTIELNDTGNKLLDASNRSSLGLAGLQDAATSRVASEQAKPFDYGSVQDVQDAAYKGYTSRLDPQWKQAQQAIDAKLANQGIVQGSEAYDNAMRSFNQGKNDAYQQANTAAIGTQGQTYQLASALRNQPLNELNALRMGSQVTNPTFNNYAQQGQTAGADLLGATQAGYNADLAGVNANNAGISNFTNGLFSLGGAALFSDRRLKSNIEHLAKIGKYDWYSYTKFGKPEIGVMAQEVAEITPSAVHVHPSGFLMVDYGAL